MSNPIVLSTWSFGAIASAAAWPVLAGGRAALRQGSGQALDAVEAGCRAVEADPSVDSVGYGGLPDRSGRVSLDACIMESPSRCGSVAGVRRHLHAVTIARRVMERTQHVMLVGEDADCFADSQGIAASELLSDSARRRWEEWYREHPDAARDYTVAWRPSTNVEEATQISPPPWGGDYSHDTVGVLALDAAGRLAGACSTSGRAFKVPGRVGDSPIIGHGLYVHPEHGAAVATGTGELVMGVCGTFLAIELMRRGATPLDAVVEVLRRITGSYEMLPEHQVAMIALAPSGAWSAAALRCGYSTAVRTANRAEQREPDVVLL